MRKSAFFPRAFSSLLALSLTVGLAALPAFAVGEDEPDAEVTQRVLPAAPDPALSAAPETEPAAASEDPTASPDPAPDSAPAETSVEPAPVPAPADPEDGEAELLDEPAPEEEPIEVMQAGDEFTPYVSVTGNGESITLEVCASSWSPSHTIEVRYADGTTVPYYLKVSLDSSSAVLEKSYFGEVTDPGVVTSVERLPTENTWDTPRYVAAVTLPAACLDGDEFTLTFEGKAYTSQELGIEPAGPSPEPSAEPSPEPSAARSEAPSEFAGFEGQLYDWSGVPLVNANCDKGYSTVEQMGVVWDGDYVYILLKADGDGYGNGNWNSVCGAGPYGNGQYAITTDMGKTMLIQPKADGNTPTVAGVAGAEAAVNNTDWNGAPHYWELKIPASELPECRESFDFGLYQCDPVITGVKDLQGGDEEDKEFNGIVIDGKYDDWKWYPHEIISYATAGTQEHVVDSQGALYTEDGVLYVHVSTNMPAHLNSKGGDLLAGISIAFNGDRDQKGTPDQGGFYPKIMDDNGNVLGEGTRLENGTYTFHIFDTRTDPFGGRQDENGNWYTPTLEQVLSESFGTVKITVNGEKDEIEFELDLEKVAEYIGCSSEDFQLIEAQFGKLGQQWFSLAGTPTGAWMGIGLCLATVGGVYAVDARKKKKNQL